MCFELVDILVSTILVKTPFHVMHCPFCKAFRHKADWSTCQWLASNHFAVAADGWPRNRCKHCSDETGWYFTTQGGPRQSVDQHREFNWENHASDGVKISKARTCDVDAPGSSGTRPTSTRPTIAQPINPAQSEQ